MSSHSYFMRQAIDQAHQSQREGGIPIGSVLVHQQSILGAGHNQRIQKGSSILHGEMDALEKAGRQTAAIYKHCTLYTTLSPCAMCTGAILLYQIPIVVIGENKTFMGQEALLESKGVQVIVLQDPDCIQMMQSFIEKNPKLWNEDIGL
jgi:cytosine/creatinine deaminase